jgi:hypothetical protein
MKGPFEGADKLSAQIYKQHRADLVKAYKKALKEIQSKISDMFVRYGDDVKYSDMASYNRLTNLEKQITDQLKILNGEVVAITKTAVKETFQLNYYYTGFVLERSTQVKLGFGLLNPSVIEASIYNQLDAIKWTDRQKQHSVKLVQQIREEITQGLIQGKGYPNISRAIREKTELTAGKTDRIVQTETHRVQTQGRIAGISKAESAAERLGMKIKRVWVATLDNKTRDTHAELDGKHADDEGLFHVRKLITEGPGLFGVAEEDINCRCSLRAEVEGFESKIRKDNISKNIIPYTTYTEWAKNRL